MRLVILAGFLGSGKTTFALGIARAAQAQGLRVAPIVNERGEAGVDNQLVARLGIERDAHRHVRSLVLAAAGKPPPGGSDYFGGGGMPMFDGVASLWFADEVDLDAFRRYEAALRATGFVDPDLSFFVYAREIEILAV